MHAVQIHSDKYEQALHHVGRPRKFSTFLLALHMQTSRAHPGTRVAASF